MDNGGYYLGSDEGHNELTCLFKLCPSPSGHQGLSGPGPVTLGTIRLSAGITAP